MFLNKCNDMPSSYLFVLFYLDISPCKNYKCPAYSECVANESHATCKCIDGYVRKGFRCASMSNRNLFDSF